jgi:3D (Asp-Asp-Asp) domain-containing protein
MIWIRRARGMRLDEGQRMKLARMRRALGLSTCVFACTASAADEELAESSDEIRTVGSFVSRGTGYYPANNSMGGGFVDRKGAKLRTLQQFLSGRADYVSVAMDSKAFAYGQRLRIKELDAKYGKSIVFRVVDTGGAFRGKGRTRIDVCTANRSASLDPTINGTLHIEVIDERSGPPEPSPNAPDPAEPEPSSSAGSGPAAPAPAPAPASDDGAGGAKCSSTGACNPGNDGSGLICVDSRCVPGCITNAQCPGSSTCQSGQCR